MAERFHIIYVTGAVQFTEASSVPGGAPGAGFGKYWVKDDAPSTAQFTDDAGVDHDLVNPSVTDAYWYSVHFDSAPGSTKHYVGWIGTGASEWGGSIGRDHEFIAPHDGELVAAYYHVLSGNPGNTTIGLHLDGNTTPTASKTETGLLDDTSYKFVFSGATFSAGQRLAVSVDPTNAPSNVYVTLQWKFDTST
jgi:hypothetical protein